MSATYPFQGKRVEPDHGGWLSRALNPGEYCLVAPVKMSDGTALPHPIDPYWVVTAPNGHSCSIDPKVHKITVHQDGTLSLSPSLKISNAANVELWHGYLVQGVWHLQKPGKK